METQTKSFSFVLKVAVGFLTAALFLSAPAAHAKASGGRKLPSFVRVLSYSEVMRLPKAKRQAYIRGLRAMMKELDRVPKKLRVSNEPDQYSQIATLLSLFAGDEAFAAAPGIPVSTPQGLKCGAGYNTRMVVKQVAGTQIEAKAVCVVGARQNKTCGSSTIGINARADGMWECATLSSFNLLPDNRKGSLRRVPDEGAFLFKVGLGALLGQKSLKDTFIADQPKAEVYAKRWEASQRPHLVIELVDPNAAPPVSASVVPPANDQDGSLARAEERARAARSRLASRGVIPQSRVGVAAGPSKAPPVVAAPRAPVPAVAHREQTNYQPVDNDGSNAIIVTPVAPSDQLAAGPEVSDEVEGQDSSTQASATIGSCDPDQAAKTCDADSVERARQQYASDPDPDCIYAGSISTYQDGKKRAYKCVAPSQFCFGSNTCASSTGERMSADYSCESNQVICNPLLFGVHADGKSPFCIEKTAQATATCDEESKADDGAVTPLDQDHAGLKEAWNDFADRLFKMCNKNEVAAALHCAECDIISKKLFALNIAARDVATCGAAIKFQDSQCDADGKCQGLPGKGRTSGGARAVTEAEVPADGDFETEVARTKRFGIRGQRAISSVPPVPAEASNVHSMSDVTEKPVESVFNTPTPRAK